MIAPTTLNLHDLRLLAALKLHLEAEVRIERALEAIEDADRKWLLTYLCGGGARIGRRPLDYAHLVWARRLRG